MAFSILTAERKSRFSSIKRRFTRTKDKKPRSHSIERSSGLDEHRYLDPNTHSQPLGKAGNKDKPMVSVIQELCSLDDYGVADSNELIYDL